MTRHVIFDVDGTLVDSVRDRHRVAFNCAFKESGFPFQWDEEEHAAFLTVTGGGRLDRWLRLQGWDEHEANKVAAELHRRKTEIFRTLVLSGGIQPRPGAVWLLRSLREAGARMHVATTGSRTWVEPLLGRLFGDTFEVMVTDSEVRRSKPAPDAHREVLRLGHVHPDHAVAVEASPLGVEAALGAGLRCLCIPNGFTEHHDLSAATWLGARLDDHQVLDWLLTA